MAQETKVFQVGPDYEGRYSSSAHEEDHMPYENYAMHSYGDLSFQRSTTKNMNILWERFNKNESFPEYYLGVAKRMAICKCPETGEEDWYNGERCLSVEKPEKGSTVLVTLKIKDKVYTRNYIFMGWLKTQVHEWQTTKGTTLQLSQNFVDGLCAKDKRYLKMYH
jgi:hypothetical protein